MPRAAFVALAVSMATAVLTGSVPRAAPQERPQQPPVFRTNTELVEVDVVVVDKAGQRVHGLTKDDFILKDRKKAQSIETFTEVQRSIERATELPRLPPETRLDVASNTTAKSGRLVVMVLDDLHTYRGRTDTVKGIARSIANDLGPESAMSLIQTGGEHGVEVTDDRSRLLGSIDKFKGRRPTRRPLEVCDPIAILRDPETADASNLDPGCEIQELNANRGLYRALEDAAKILGRDDKRRKAFILVSENVAKDISGLFDGGEQIANIVSRNPRVAAPVYEYQLLNTMNAMRRGNVATYSIDPRGLISPQELAEECFPPPGGARGIDHDPCVGDEVKGSPTAWNAWVRKAQQGLTIMSEETGGFAVVNTDDFTGGISQIIGDLDNYYLLGFYPSDVNGKGYRPIDVEVKGRPELTLRYRRGYQLEGAPDPPKPTSELNRLVGGALPKNDLPLRLQAIPMPPGPAGGKNARVVIALELTVPTTSMKEAESDRLLDDIEYGMYAVDIKGAKVRERQSSGAKVTLRPRPGLVVVPDKVTYEIVSEMPLPPGQYQLRASATSKKLNAGGSVYLSFDVPDFSKDDLQLTDLVIAYADGPHVPIARDLPPVTMQTTSREVVTRGTVPSISRPSAAVPPTLPVPVPTIPFDPTLDRAFVSRDTLRLYFKAVQRSAMALTATISALAPDGTVVVTFDRVLEAGTQPSLDISLPLTQLAPGPYRLQVVVTDGTNETTREVALIIRP
ncbi:MAG: VWA domain-containing protein [Acidobacteria bacterium]|nr:VWA domain-containing protein [Acidobacteriota bacterium]